MGHHGKNRQGNDCAQEENTDQLQDVEGYDRSQNQDACLGEKYQLRHGQTSQHKTGDLVVDRGGDKGRHELIQQAHYQSW